MPRAGFYTVESGKISFRRDGNWYSDDERIDNPRIALLFSQSIKRNPDGSYYLQVAEERASISSRTPRTWSRRSRTTSLAGS